MMTIGWRTIHGGKDQLVPMQKEASQWRGPAIAKFKREKGDETGCYG